jgi:hypothetical protein
VPQNASISGSCASAAGDPNIQEITLQWDPKGHTELGLKHNLTFVFIQQGTAKDGNVFLDPYYELNSIQARIWSNELDFPDAMDTSMHNYLS